MTRSGTRKLAWTGAGLALGVCAPVAIAAAAQGDTATGAPAVTDFLANLPRLLGRMHPVLVHFPIALLIAGVLFECVSIVLRRDRDKPSPAALACVVVGALGAAIAAWAGWLNADIEPHGSGVSDLMETHRWLGIVAASLAGVALIGGLIGASGKARAMTGLYRVALVLAAGVVGVAGHWGGSIVYGEGYLTEALFPAPQPPNTEALLAELEDSGATLTVDFATQIMPIFEDSCIECHGASKKKGNLRLDSRVYAMDSRDADEQVIIPGDSFASELTFRISLPHDDEDLMPPEGKGDPLTPEQIALIETWIDEGAVWIDVPVVAGGADSPPTDTTKREPAPEAAAPPPLVLDQAARAQQAASLDALQERGAVAGPVAIDQPWVDVRFDLLGGSVTDADLALLDALEPTLVSLNLGGTSITDEGVATLGRFSHLERLHLDRTATTDAGVEHLAGLSHLRYLNLYSTPVTDAALVTIARLPALEDVYLWQTGVSPEAAALLAALRPGVVVDLGQAPAPAQFPADEPPEPETAEGAGPTEPRLDLASLPDCCKAAAQAGGECDHPCCVEARLAGEICKKCASQ